MVNQEDLFDTGCEKKDLIDKKYTAKIKAPIYTPKHYKPSTYELVDCSKSDMLIAKIQKSNVSKLEKEFLIEAAKRHTVFNYARIADYYAHSEKEMQELMEQSALVIIDFDKAIEYGYVKLSDEIAEQYIEDTANAE
jgi:hypothetical protein